MCKKNKKKLKKLLTKTVIVIKVTIMKIIKYPNRIVVPVDEKHGNMLETLAKSEIRNRPQVFLAALEFYFDKNCECAQSQRKEVRVDERG